MQSNLAPRITIFSHIYYTHLFSEFSAYLKDLKAYNTEFYFNLGPMGNRTELIHAIRTEFPGAFILESPNIGKDLGGKLAMLDLYLNLGKESEYMLLIHDKLSPQLVYGDKWREELLEITKKEKIQEVISSFESDPEIGIIGSALHISSELDGNGKKFKSTNGDFLEEYIQRMNLNLKDYSFIAGNIFWIRASIYEAFFKEHPPMKLRSELEKGNVMDSHIGTRTHALERVFGWIALSEGFSINGI